MSFQKLNNVFAWAAFFVALVTYTLTVEPTASFWDCGEFIACAYKLEVPHPSGAPFYLLIGRIASLFAGGDVTKVALMVNMVSVLASAFTILFLFWTISLLARKLFGKRGEELSNYETILVIAASLVGSLAYTFTDSFWFSAVEAEVYGMSSFFTAIVVWAAFRWELIDNESAANRWLLFVAYLVGLSIGVHLLNLVTIPALALIYFYKKSKNITFKNGFIAFMSGMVALAVVNTGVITGLPSIGFAIERMFVNGFGLPFSSGLVFFVALLIGALVYGIRWSAAKGKVGLNTSLLAFAFILVGYSTYTIALIRSNYNPPINENNPSNVLNYVSYLKREQYGSRPLLYGPVYTAKLADIKNGDPVYRMTKDKYEIYDYSPEYVWDEESKMLLPRVWSSDPNHVRLYQNMLGVGEGQRPNLANNLEFMMTHQMGKMYWRYFLWNFWGRASDIEGSGATDIFEKKTDLPQILATNKGRTNFYGIPIVFGIIGLLIHYFRREKDFLVLLLLFLFTGLALVVYLNSPPVEPRERDYIYVGSFYFFAIWIGFGVIGIAEFIKKIVGNENIRAISATALGLAVPVLIGTQTWKGHDRSERYHQVDFAKNLLNSCAKNAILFTGGDNDTFPLWYAQEVEGFRTDVRVCNLSLLGTEWYIDQMKRKTYESEALPISFTMNEYNKGINDQIPFYENSNERIKAGILLKDYLELVRKNDPSIQIPISREGETINTLPSENLFLTYNPEQVKALGFVPKANEEALNGVMAWSIGKRDLLKNDLIVLDIIAQNNWKRPIYFAGTLSSNSYLNLKPYMQLEGYAYRLMPVNTQQEEGGVNSEVMYNNLMKKSFWRNLDNPDVYYDSETYLKVPIITARYAFLRLAENYINEGQKAKAEEVLDKAQKLMPDKTIPYDQLTANFAMFYYVIEKPEKAKQIVNVMTKRADESLRYFVPMLAKGSKQWGSSNVSGEVQMNMSILRMLGNVHNQYNKKDKNESQALYEKYAAMTGN
jgi:Protein of unknown function (DUF2723)